MMKFLMSFFLSVFLCLSLQADNMYLTFLSGNPIQQGELSLKVDKKETPITEFFAVNVADASHKVLHHPAGRRSYFLVYDLIFSKPEELLAARKATEAWLAKLNKEDLVCVISLPKTGGLRLLSGLTSDRSKTIIALNQLGLKKISGYIQGPEGNLYPEQFSPAAESPILIPDALFLQNLVQDTVDEKKKQDPASLFVTAFSDLAYAMTSVQGRKSMILFSPGFDTKGAKIKMDEKSFADDYVDRVITEPEYLATPEEQRAVQEQMRRQERELSTERRMTPSIQVEGIPEFVSGTFTTVHVISPSSQKQDFYQRLTSQTGGLYILLTETDSADWPDRILALDQNYYVVGFQGKPEKEFKELHPLKLEAPGKEILASEKWVAPRSYPQYGPLERKLYLSQALYVDHQQTSPYTFWADFIYDQQIPKIPLFAQIKGQELIQKDVSDLTLEFYSFAMNVDGQIYDYSVVPIRMDLKNKKLRERLAGTGLRMWSLLLAKPGPALVRLVLVEPQWSEAITFSTQLEISSSDLTTTYPFFPSVNLNWMVWPNPDAPPRAHRGIPKSYPYHLGEKEFFFPELSPTLKKSESGQVVYFKIYNLLPESKNPPIRLMMVDSAGKSTEIENFGLLQKPRSLEHGGMELFWKLLSLPDLSPGPYRFKVQIKDVRKGREIIREIPMQIS